MNKYCGYCGRPLNEYGKCTCEKFVRSEQTVVLDQQNQSTNQQQYYDFNNYQNSNQVINEQGYHQPYQQQPYQQQKSYQQQQVQPNYNQAGSSGYKIKHTINTAGMTFYVGIAGCGLMVLSVLMLMMPTTASRVYSTLLGGSLAATYMYLIIALAVNPGIYLILLLTGYKKPIRGTAFGVVWIVISGMGLFYSIGTIAMLTDSYIYRQLMPASLTIALWLEFLGKGCILAASILFLVKKSNEKKQYYNKY